MWTSSIYLKWLLVRRIGKLSRGTVFPPNARRYLFVAIDRATR